MKYIEHGTKLTAQNTAKQLWNVAINEAEKEGRTKLDKDGNSVILGTNAQTGEVVEGFGETIIWCEVEELNGKFYTAIDDEFVDLDFAKELLKTKLSNVKEVEIIKEPSDK